MELNKRCLEILCLLGKKDTFVSLDAIAAQYGLTVRAIRYDIDKIEAFLVNNGYGWLDRQHGKGVKLQKKDGIDGLINSFIKMPSPRKYIYSKEERFSYIATKLLESVKATKITSFVKELGVSKNTILKEMDLVAEWLQGYKLGLIRRHRIGVWVEGPEFNKRKAIIELASQSMTPGHILNYINKKIVQSKIENLQLNMLFSNVDLDFMDELIIAAETILGKKFSDTAYVNLIAHIAITLKRISGHHDINLPEIKLDDHDKSGAYSVAATMVKRLEGHYNIKIPDQEIDYIMLHLLSAKILKGNYRNDSPDELYHVVTLMTDEMEQIYNVSFGVKKPQIIEGLVLHLRPTIYRIKFKLEMNNPIYEQVIANYHELFLNTKKVAGYLENYLEDRVADQEISFLTMHYAAALENVEIKNNKVKVVIVCGTGIGTAAMIASQLEKRFAVEIIDSISCRDLNSIRGKDYDLIVSTVEIPDYDPGDYIKISPFLLREDYDQLNLRLQCNYLKNGYDEKRDLLMVNRFIDIMSRYCRINDRQQLQYELLYELKRHKEDFAKGRLTYMLNDLLVKERIKLNAVCNDWVEAVKCGTNLLKQAGCIDDRYEANILKNFSELGPYMVVSPGVVISHARPEDGVKQLSMSLVTLKNPIKFGHDLNDPVKLVITLATTDNESHLKALSQLMELLMRQEDMERILKAVSKEEIIEIINRYSS
jgi:mannitol operon transcriptional antiterminator